MSQPSPGPWAYENVPVPDDRTAYGMVTDADGKCIFDALNSDVAEIREEYDEAGVYRWDEQARQNLTLAAAAHELRDACRAALVLLGDVRPVLSGAHALAAAAVRVQLGRALDKAKPRGH